METKDRNDELMELKGQMELLKKELHKNEIVGEEQITDIARSYRPKHRYLKATLGALAALVINLNFIIELIFHFEEISVWEICCSVVLLIATMCFYIMISAGNTYKVKDGRLLIQNNIFRNNALDIPIDKIRFIEFMANKKLGARIMYNKFDDFYLRDINFTELVKDILKVNPDIEIRRELA